ncbi:hypothetical protein AC579_9727 [Pseudocercospora musae]|uniref:Uncharacterized protein n=1 Tax=Pseudocercospora musae TaxID=113226 RepID=A0A139HZG9_9PEZI|nr:hypothetical protein AC579_9727 [Pseudocercospora musae]
MPDWLLASMIVLLHRRRIYHLQRVVVLLGIRLDMSTTTLMAVHPTFTENTGNCGNSLGELEFMPSTPAWHRPWSASSEIIHDLGVASKDLAAKEEHRSDSPKRP